LRHAGQRPPLPGHAAYLPLFAISCLPRQQACQPASGESTLPHAGPNGPRPRRVPRHVPSGRVWRSRRGFRFRVSRVRLSGPQREARSQSRRQHGALRACRARSAAPRFGTQWPRPARR